MTEKHEFASPAWLETICELAQRRIRDSGIDLSGIDYTFGEEFLDVPERLRPPAGGRIGFCVRVADRAVQTATQPPPPDADSCNVADWETVEPLSHMILGEDPARDAEVGKLVQELEAQGKLRRQQRRERPPALTAALGDLHNAMARLTAPRQTSEVAALAARLERAFAGGADATSKALDEYATDPLDVSHVPAHPSDGPWDKAAFIAARHAWDESLVGAERTCAVTSTGQRIEVVQTLGLPATDGDPLRATIRSVWTVEGGRLSRVVGHHPDSEAESAIREALDRGRAS